MSAVTATPMTTEQLLALPRDGVERWLIRGQLREKPMTVRHRRHSLVLINIGYWLKSWLRQQPEPRGQILGGEAGCRLRHSPTPRSASTWSTSRQRRPPRRSTRRL